MVIHGKVYNITKFLEEVNYIVRSILLVKHPGGEEVLLEQAGLDASDSFDEIGHSDDAKDLLNTMYIGNLDPTVIYYAV